MGLGGQKRRTKLSQDPNNTAWSKSTTNYGHRILSAQGWKPGDFLGAKGASHAAHYTAANASHIRVLLREDNLGLGAKVGGSANAETFGLSTLSGIFGRLNGKSDAEVQKQQNSLRDAELRTYQVQKYGFMNFVSGGLLIGDKIEAVPEKKVDTSTVGASRSSIAQVEEAGKKRKVEELHEDSDAGKHVKKAKGVCHLDESAASSDSMKPKISQTKRTKALDEIPSERAAIENESSGTCESVGEEAVARGAAKEVRRAEKERRRAERKASRAKKEKEDGEEARFKHEKRARKEERRKRKDQKRLAQVDAPMDNPSASQGAQPAIATTTRVTSTTTSGNSTPTSGFGGGRHAVRQRYIQQKRMASMDAKALNEILMIKTVQA